MAPDTDPLILTLLLDDEAQAEFERQRRRHFPSALNRIPAHVSLFHALPGEAEAEIVHRLRLASAVPAFPVRVVAPMKLGRGTAWRLEAPPLSRLRAELAEGWRHWLTAQDRQAFRPHLTIQNKVAPEAARALYDGLAAGFEPRDATARGLALWRYRGGPWDAAGEFPFAPPA